MCDVLCNTVNESVEICSFRQNASKVCQAQPKAVRQKNFDAHSIHHRSIQHTAYRLPTACSHSHEMDKIVCQTDVSMSAGRIVFFFATAMQILLLESLHLDNTIRMFELKKNIYFRPAIQSEHKYIYLLVKRTRAQNFKS